MRATVPKSQPDFFPSGSTRKSKRNFDVTEYLRSAVLHSWDGCRQRPGRERRIKLIKMPVIFHPDSKIISPNPRYRSGQRVKQRSATVARMDAGVRAYMDVFTACR